jgi:PEGA domain-containing protein
MPSNQILLIVAVAFAGASCSSLGLSGRSTKQVQILSEPPGARIEINGGYVGDAPVTVTIPTLRGWFTQITTIRALPTRPGQYVQSKVFQGGFTTIPNDAVPSRVFFEMRLGPASPEINVNVNPY